MAVITASKDDDEKLGNSIGRLTEGDVTLSIRRDPETHQTLLIGMGEQQLDVAMARLRNQFHVNAELKTPRVGYKETITRSGEGSHRHKKQSGGHGQFGEVHLRLKPLARGEGFKFTDAIVGGVVPGKFIPSVEKGIKERLVQGIQAGCPVVDVEAELFYGKDHAVDSSDLAFKMAGSKCFQAVALACNPILLEPIMMVTIRVPKQYMGEVISDLNTKRGRVMGMDSDGDDQIIQAQAPLAEMYRYAVDLRSITRSWGTFDMVFSQYEPVPREVADKVIAAVNKVEEEE
jgi:elongation factor G